MTSAPPTHVCLVVWLCCAAAAGCTAKGRWSEMDQLREELQSAQTQIARITAERDEARAKLSEADRVRLATGESLAADAAAALPRCAEIRLDRLSGFERNRDVEPSRFAALNVYITPLDGRGRFVQVVGTMNVTVDRLPPPGSADAPARVASVSFSPADLREAYRSSVMGTHYSIRVPLSSPILAGPGAAAVTVEFLDALTGVVHRAERVIPTDARPLH